jgi:hypothetical protein
MSERVVRKLEEKVGLVHGLYYSAWYVTITQELQS